jgi:hypothetical protein
VIIAILVSQTVFTLWPVTLWLEDSLDHGAKLTELGEYTDLSFLQWWSYEYQQSLVADTYGVLLIVLLRKWLREVGSAESTDE